MIDLDSIAARFDRFDLSSNGPAWSSSLLRRFVAEVLAEPGGSMILLIRGLDLALERQHVRLTVAVANFIQDLSVTGFEMDRGWWDQADWAWVKNNPMREIGAARAYLLLRNLPPSATTPALLNAMIHDLSGSCRHDEAVASLADDLNALGMTFQSQENGKTQDDTRSSAAPPLNRADEANVIIGG